MEEYDNIDWKFTHHDDEDFLSEESLKETYVSRYLLGQLNVDELKEDPVNEYAARQEARRRRVIPGARYELFEGRKSSLNVDEHVMLMKAAKLLAAGRTFNTGPDKVICDFYNNTRSMVLNENRLYQVFAEASWKKTFGRKPLKLNTAINSYVACLRANQLMFVLTYPRYYERIDLVPFSYGDDDVPVEMVHVANNLDLGKVAKFSPPDLQERFQFRVNSLPPLKEKRVNSELPVSRDKNVDEIVALNDVDIVISLGGLRKMVNFGDEGQEWHIPIVIKEVQGPQGTLKKIVYIDKPLAKLQPLNLDMNGKCAKLQMRTNFCKLVGFEYPATDISIDECKIDSQKETGYNVMHNVSYKTWTLAEKEESNVMLKRSLPQKRFNVLVRAKLDACKSALDGMLCGVTVVPKMEYQLDFGANVCTRQELAGQWTSLYFKPRSYLYRVRTHYSSMEVVKVEQCDVQQVVNEAIVHHNFKPQSGLGVLYKLAHELTRHPSGNYLLIRNDKSGTFAMLLQEACRGIESQYDLHGTYEKQAKVVDDRVKAWCPIDVSVILPMHEHAGRMPGLFDPCKVAKKQHFPNNNLQKKWKGKKKKKKNKAVYKKVQT